MKNGFCINYSKRLSENHYQIGLTAVKPLWQSSYLQSFHLSFIFYLWHDFLSVLGKLHWLNTKSNKSSVKMAHLCCVPFCGVNDNVTLTSNVKHLSDKSIISIRIFTDGPLDFLGIRTQNFQEHSFQFAVQIGPFRCRSEQFSHHPLLQRLSAQGLVKGSAAS